MLIDMNVILKFDIAKIDKPLFHKMRGTAHLINAIFTTRNGQ